MTSSRDGHVRVLPLHVANKIAAGEVVERPASVVKELVENAIDAGSGKIAIAITQGGRKLISVQDDGCGMTRDDAVLALERQATSKIRDVADIENIDTLGFRGEAIPSIASVSRFSIVTRRRESDEGTRILVNAGTLSEVASAGCPIGTLVEVRDLFCNVPARRKFLRAYVTEENHVRQVFTTYALAHPNVGFSLSIDGRELYRLAPSAVLADRIRELFGEDFLQNATPIPRPTASAPRQTITVSGFIEKPNLSTPTRREQYVFVNGRPATSASIAYALREAYPRRAGDSRPAAILFIDLPANQVDVNVHPMKREVRFRDNVAVKTAIMDAISRTMGGLRGVIAPATEGIPPASPLLPADGPHVIQTPDHPSVSIPDSGDAPSARPDSGLPAQPVPQPIPLEFALEPDSPGARPWRWFKFLAQSASGYLLIETDSGIVTINPHAARERIAYERLLDSTTACEASQDLLIPETVTLSPVEAARIRASLDVIRRMGFQLEEFGRDVFKIESIPQLLGSANPAAILSTIAKDLADETPRVKGRGGARWREEAIAKSIAKSFSGASMSISEEGAVKLVEELCACRMPYVCPRGKLVMIFTSTRELDRKFSRI